MFSADAEIKFQITVDAKTGKASIDNLGNSLAKTENKAKSVSSKVSSTLGTIGDGFSKLGGNLTKFVTVPVTGLGVATLKTAVDFVKLKESSMGVFKQMLGGVDAADKMYESLLSIAKASTYSQEAFLIAGKTLVGMGTSADKTAKYLQAITNAVAGFGGTSADIESLATVFGKVQAKGKVLTDDLNMLAERGVNGLQILAAHYKVTTDEMQDMVSKGMVPAEKGLDILCDGMENGYTYAGKFHQGMAGMAQSLKSGTLTGALDSLKSSFRNMSVQMWDAFENKPEMIEAVNAIGNAMSKLPTIMGPITKAIGPMFQSFADRLNKIAILAEQHPKLFENIVKAIIKLATAGPVLMGVSKGFNGVSNIIEKLTKEHTAFGKTFTTGGLILKSFSKIGRTLFKILKGGITVIKLVASGVKMLTTVMMANPIGLIITAIAALIAIFVILYNKCEGFRNMVDGVVSAIIGFLEKLWDNICTITNNVVSIVSNVINKVVNFLKKIWNNICTITNNVVSIVSAIVSKIVNILAIPFDYVKNAFILIVALGAMALEGIYNVVMWLINGAMSLFSTIAMWVYNNVLLPVYNFFSLVFITIFNFLNWWLNLVFSTLINIAMWVYNNVLLPIFNFFSMIFTAIYNVIIGFINGVISVFSTIASWIYTNALIPIYNFFSSIWNGILNIITNVVSKIKTAFNNVATVVKNVFNNVKKFISNIFSSIAGIIKAPINGVIGIINNILKAMNKIKVPDWVPGLGGKSVNFKMIPKLSVGTNYVQHEGLAYLHQGEAVVPKKYNPAIGGYGNSNQIVYVTVEANMDVNKFGKAFVRDIKTFSGGTKNSYNYGGGK